MRPAVHAALLALTCLPAGTRRACPLALLPRRTAVIRLAATPDPDPYGALGVASDATAAQIKQAYRRLALKNHPDVNKAADAEAAAIAASAPELGPKPKKAEEDAGPEPNRNIVYDDSTVLQDGSVVTEGKTIGKLQPDGETVVGDDGHVVGSRDTHGGLIIEHQHVTNAAPSSADRPWEKPGYARRR